MALGRSKLLLVCCTPIWFLEVVPGTPCVLQSKCWAEDLPYMMRRQVYPPLLSEKYLGRTYSSRSRTSAFMVDSSSEIYSAHLDPVVSAVEELGKAIRPYPGSVRICWENADEN